MSADNEFLELLNHRSGRGTSAAVPANEKREEADEESCAAFGFMRGMQEKALAVEFRLRNGDREWFPYSWLGPWRYNPSAGLLLKFTGDIVTLVFIRGSNLDAPVNDSGMNLTCRGLQRHRVTWIREMDEEELGMEGGRKPTIDAIDIVELESHQDVQEWMKKNAPAFARR